MDAKKNLPRETTRRISWPHPSSQEAPRTQVHCLFGKQARWYTDHMLLCTARVQRHHPSITTSRYDQWKLNKTIQKSVLKRGTVESNYADGKSTGAGRREGGRNTTLSHLPTLTSACKPTFHLVKQFNVKEPLCVNMDSLRTDYKPYYNRPFPSTVYLCFKTSRSAQPFLWKRVLLTSSFSSKSNSLSFEWFRAWTRFETEAKGNSEMAYCWNTFCRCSPTVRRLQ